MESENEQLVGRVQRKKRNRLHSGRAALGPFRDLAPRELLGLLESRQVDIGNPHHDPGKEPDDRRQVDLVVLDPDLEPVKRHPGFGDPPGVHKNEGGGKVRLPVRFGPLDVSENLHRLVVTTPLGGDDGRDQRRTRSGCVVRVQAPDQRFGFEQPALSE